MNDFQVEPTFSDALEELWESLPYHYRLADRPDFHLKRFLAGVCGPMTDVLDAIDDIMYTPPEDGVLDDTSALVDIVTLRPEWAYWRAQLSGITLPADLPFEQQKEVLADARPVRLKGTMQTMITAAKSALAGSKYVAVYPWTNNYNTIGQGTMWEILVVTKRSETLVNNAPRPYALSQVPSLWTGLDDNGEPLKVNIWRRDGFYNDYALRFFKNEDAAINEVFTRYTAEPIPFIVGNPHIAMMKVATSGDVQEVGMTIRVNGHDASGAIVDTASSAQFMATNFPTQQTVEFLFNAPVEKITVGVQVETSDPMTYLDIGELGVREGDDPLWIPETTDVLSAMRRLRAVPAGIMLYHETFATDWDTIEAVLPTWNDWESVTWNELEETELP